MSLSALPPTARRVGKPGCARLRRQIVSGAAILRAAVLCIAIAAAGPARADAAASVVRDTEIEADIRTMASPIWRAAGLEPNDIRIYLVQDKTLNAFVAGGQNLFLNTGLVMRAESSSQLMGVIAHETGHIAGGHLVRAQEAMRNASIETILAMVLGAAAAAVSRNGGAAAAVMMGGAGMAQATLLRYSVTQEASADQAGMTFLDRSGMSCRGLLQFLQILEGEELLSASRQDPYLRSHPLTTERVDAVRTHIARSRFSDAPDPPGYAETMKRIKVKLNAFLSDPATTLAAYSEKDQSVLARYARAIAYYRMPALDKAVPAIDALIRDFPTDPYFRELKGQMLFENGRLKEARQPYEDAVRLAPSSPLLRISLSQVYLESGDSVLNKRAIALLNDALRTEDKDPTAWHFLATAYGRDNQMGMAALSLAEEGLAAGKKKDAMQQANRAQQLLPRNSPSYQRAEGIHREAERLETPDPS